MSRSHARIQRGRQGLDVKADGARAPAERDPDFEELGIHVDHPLQWEETWRLQGKEQFRHVSNRIVSRNIAVHPLKCIRLVLVRTWRRAYHGIPGNVPRIGQLFGLLSQR